LHRAIDGSGAPVDVMLSERRDLAAAKASFRSARTVTGIASDRVLWRDPLPEAGRYSFGGWVSSGLR